MAPCEGSSQQQQRRSAMVVSAGGPPPPSELTGGPHEERLRLLREAASLPGDSGTSPLQPPPWLERERFYRAKLIFQRYFFSFFFAHLAGLMMVVLVPSMAAPLLSTGKSSNLLCLFRRYMSTLQHVRRWYEGDVWNTTDEAHKSLVRVRQMHRRVGEKLTNDGNQGCCPVSGSPLPISQQDMALTQFAFLGFIIMYPKRLGIFCSREDLECLIHFWRGIGYLLGIDDAVNVCCGDYDETVAWCRQIQSQFMGPAVAEGLELPQPRRMSRSIVQAINGFIVFLSWEALARFWFELLELPCDFPMGLYERLGYRLMNITFGLLLRLRIFHELFNFLLRLAIKHAIDKKDKFEKILIRRMELEAHG